MYLVHFRRGEEADQFLAKKPLDVISILERQDRECAEEFFLRVERLRTLPGVRREAVSCAAGG
ncbi:MAG: hypothetical protein NTU62_10445 [Spirochaetes bacterium]|nr:hypothetical protein [Spirochaetota bacterium]